MQLRAGHNCLATTRPTRHDPAVLANVAHLNFVNALEVSGSAAGLSLLKCLLANLFSAELRPSLLPSPPAWVVNDIPE